MKPSGAELGFNVDCIERSGCAFELTDVRIFFGPLSPVTFLVFHLDTGVDA